MRRQLENFANALSDYSGEDVDTPKDWHAAFRITMEMTRISGQTELILPCIVRGRDSRLNICVWTSSLRSKLLWAYQVWLPVSVHGEAKWVRKEIPDWSVDWPSRRRDWPLRRKVRFGFIFNYQRLRICLAVCLFALLRGYLRRKGLVFVIYLLV